jgi:hypothetical protein
VYGHRAALNRRIVVYLRRGHVVSSVRPPTQTNGPNQTVPFLGQVMPPDDNGAAYSSHAAGSLTRKTGLPGEDALHSLRILTAAMESRVLSTAQRPTSMVGRQGEPSSEN